MAWVVKEPTCQCRKPTDAVQFLGWKDPLEEEMATLSSTLAWRIPWTEAPGELQSMGSHRVEQDWVTNTNLYKGFINMKSPAFTNQGTSITLTHLLYSVASSPLEAPLSPFLELSLGLKSHGGKKKYSLWSYTWLVQNPPGNAGDAGDSGSVPGSGRSPGVGNGNPLQYSFLGNPMDRGAWWAAVHKVTKSWTRQSHQHIREELIILSQQGLDHTLNSKNVSLS